MNTKQRLLMAGACVVGAVVLSATMRVQAAVPKMMTLKDVSGAVRLQQNLPCGNRLDLTTSIAHGGMQLSWVQVTRGEVMIDLTRLNMLLTPFRAEANCRGLSAAVDFHEIGAQLASAIRFKAAQSPESAEVHFRIPKEQFLIYESVVSSANPGKTETAYRRPAEDVTGVLDLRRQTAQLHVVLTTEMRFRVGCQGDRCAIDERHIGTATTDLRGATAPVTPTTAKRTTVASVEPRR